MNIYEAVSIAKEEGGCITLPEYIGYAKIKPTNEKGNCIIMLEDGERRSEHGWQPCLDDLLRTDWMFTE